MIAGTLRLLLALLATAPLRAAALEEVDVRARLSLRAPHVDGSVRFRWRNDTDGPVRSLRLRVPANRFVEPPPWNDLSRHFLLAAPTYRPGGTELVAVQRDGDELAVAPSKAESTTVDLARNVAPGETIDLKVRFRTTLPTIADTFGVVGDTWIASNGWYPTLEVEAERSGGSDPPPIRYVLTAPRAASLLVNGRVAESSPTEGVSASGRVSVALSHRPFEVMRTRIGRRQVTVVSAEPDELRHRISRHPLPPAAILDTLPSILAESDDQEPLVVVRLPLRWLPSESGPDAVIVTDRLFEIHPILWPIHQRELAYAVFLQEELRRARGRETGRDGRWIAEGLAWRRAEALYRRRFREGRDVGDWIRLFDVFAIVDRFETAPRIPFLRAFFPVLAADDPLGIRPDSPLPPRLPGRFVFSRLKARLRPRAFRSFLERYRRERGTFREILRESAGDDAVRFLDSWLGQVPELDYSIEDVRRNPEGRPGASFRIARESADRRPDTVEVSLETTRGQERLFVDVDGAYADVAAATSAEVEAVQLDPDRRAIESRLDDNRSPPELHVLLDSADVEVSSTEFGVSTLVVARRRYDYRKDLAAAGFYTSRSLGVNGGFQLHGGKPIDRNLFRHNLFVYYSFQELDRDFGADGVRELRASGRLGGIGFRYNFYDAFWFENPSLSRHARVFFDGYDEGLGGDFGYVQTGANLTLTTRVQEDTVVAAHVLNGFSIATGSGPIPAQGLFSLGGFRSIRGIDAEEDLAESIFVVRGEVRRLLPFRLDLDLDEIVIARRLQAKLFVDAGRVESDRGRLYDPEGFAVGAGAGVNLFYDFLGFFPTSFYLDVATRVDRRSGVQVLFGARQAF